MKSVVKYPLYFPSVGTLQSCHSFHSGRRVKHSGGFVGHSGGVVDVSGREVYHFGELGVETGGLAERSVEVVERSGGDVGHSGGDVKHSGELIWRSGRVVKHSGGGAGCSRENSVRSYIHFATRRDFPLLPSAPAPRQGASNHGTTIEKNHQTPSPCGLLEAQSGDRQARRTREKAGCEKG